MGFPSDSATKRREAVTGAMLLFWKTGAETATYDQIVAATHLSRKSLYALWPEKGALIGETITAYREGVLALLVAPLREPGRVGLERFWSNLEAAMREPGWQGCYLFRTAGGPLRDAPEIKQALADYLTELQGLLEASIGAASTEGLGPTAKPDLAAVQAVGLICALSAIGAQRGFDAFAERLLLAARVSCGLGAAS